MWYNAFGIQGDNESITSTFVYNKKGFADSINLSVTNNVYGNFTATRSSVSTCDNFTAIPNHISTGKSLIPLNTFKQFYNRLPSPFYNKRISN
ncbi:MAG TPA: hypothetical protein VFW07_09060 [Parafilimonas sp.]|nr:hypothetical protein [Parafilimonas sp.]